MKAFEEYGPRLAAWQALASVLLLVAIQPLVFPLGSPPVATSTMQDAEQFFFEPHQGSPVLILLVMGFLAWRRRDAFLASPGRPRPIPAMIATAVAGFFVVWSRLNDATDHLMLAILAGGFAFAFATRGFDGARTMSVALVPALFALPIPGRLSNEIVWFLQLASAAGAELLLNTFGVDVQRDGVFIERGGLGFLIIESCSGFRMLHTLSLLSIVIGDLLTLGRRGVLLFVVAPLVAFALNVLRVAWIVLGEEGTADASQHVGQGLTVLIAGMAILFALGLRLERAAREAAGSEAGIATGSETDRPLGVPVWRRLAAVLAVFAVAAHVVPAWPRSTRVASLSLVDFEDRPRWTVEEVGADRMFLGALGIGRIVRRRFEHAGSRQAIAGAVELFVGIESGSFPRRSPFSPLLVLPSRHFGIEQVSAERDFRIGREYREAVTRRGDQRFLTRVWYLNDPGPGVEVLRSFFALDRGPFDTHEVRVAIRVGTPIPEGGPDSLRAARGLLDLFVIRYRDELAAYDR